jgi:hypothetical protein
VNGLASSWQSAVSSGQQLAVCSELWPAVGSSSANPLISRTNLDTQLAAFTEHQRAVPSLLSSVGSLS